MFKINMQKFAEAVKGTKIVFLYRVHDTANETAGATLAFTTENSISIEVDADSTATKDGAIRTPGEPEITVSSTSVFKKGDTKIDEYRKALLDGSLMDIWRANLEEPGSTTGTYKGQYFQGYLTSFEETSNSEDYVEYSLEFGINGKGADGDVTVPDSEAEAASYVFADSTATGA